MPNEIETENASQQPPPSYQGASNKSSSKSPILQILLLLAVIIVFVLGLAYFNLLPISKLSNLFSNKPASTLPVANPNVKPDAVITITATPIPVSTDVPQILVVSDIPSYQLTLVKQTQLVDLFKSWNAFAYLSAIDPTQTKLQKITIHLTDKEQKGNKVANPKIGVFLSSDVKVTNGAADLVIQVGTPVLTDPKYDSAMFFQSELLTFFYNISHPLKSASELTQSQKDRDKSISNFFTKFGDVFQIKKI